MKFLSLCLLLSIVILTGFGCIFQNRGGQIPDDVINAQKEDLNNTGQINMTGKNGENISFNNGEIPKDFPSDVPIYPKSKVLVSINYSDKHVNTLSLETDDKISQIEKFYKKELASKGWKIEKVFSTDKSVMFTGSKKNRTAGIAVTVGAKSRNTITISITEM
ncbi:MAG: hypothetical protein ABRQ38_05950 [Candidatus Eremiobacterota bacterium]